MNDLDGWFLHVFYPFLPFSFLPPARDKPFENWEALCDEGDAVTVEGGVVVVPDGRAGGGCTGAVIPPPLLWPGEG